jgi:23S rRNA pseudouridine1911/1915/1917 synthase
VSFSEAPTAAADPSHRPADEQAGERRLVLPETAAGRRLDQVLPALLPAVSRSRLQDWIAQGRVLVDGRVPRRRDRVRGGEQVDVRPVLQRDEACRPQPIGLDIVYEDAHLLVVNKPAGLVVHPAAGHPDGTLQNALLHHDAALAALPRCGIVHRLDKDTSGLMVVARSLLAHRSLVQQLASRSAHREYRALVVGEVVAGGRIDAPIGRHPVRRTAMAVVGSGRPAVTDYRILARYRGHTLLAATLQTGRTHQIRVHMAHIRHPLVGDPLYGARPRPPRQAQPALVAALQGFPRQALHALRLGLIHPASAEPMRWEVPMAADLDALLALLWQDRESHVD